MILIMLRLLNSKLSCGLPPYGRVPSFVIRNSIFSKRSGQAGFTLIEVVIIIVIVSVFMATIGVPLLTSLRESDLPEIATIAYFLGLEKLEELGPQTTGSISAEAKAVVSGYGDYEREVVVADVDCDDLTTSDPGSGCRKVTVTVYHSRIPNGVSLVSLRTAY
jgi:prepilin-type N-terminal cleavage/methylation domain-containing protein